MGSTNVGLKGFGSKNVDHWWWQKYLDVGLKITGPLSIILCLGLCKLQPTLIALVDTLQHKCDIGEEDGGGGSDTDGDNHCYGGGSSGREGDNDGYSDSESDEGDGGSGSGSDGNNDGYGESGSDGDDDGSGGSDGDNDDYGDNGSDSDNDCYGDSDAHPELHPVLIVVTRPHGDIPQVVLPLDFTGVLLVLEGTPLQGGG